MSHDAVERRRTPLAGILAERIRQSGPIAVADYVDACLRHPEHGYYRSQAAIGRDFITAPEISQMFGELIGLWCVVVWQRMGRPNPFQLVELGPGRGTMMRDMLNAARVAPDFLAATRISMIELNATLAGEQRSLLCGSPTPMAWLDRLPDTLASPAIIVGNEFLDTSPVSQYVRTATSWEERAVGLDADGLLQFTAIAADAVVEGRLSRRFPQACAGDIAEVGHHATLDWLAAQAQRQDMVALLVDYGHAQSAPGDTLQAVRRHRHEHPLCSPGEADLTAHVDFEEVAHRLTATSSLVCDGPVTQAEFLGAIGLVERASRLMAANPAKALAVETAAQRLLATGGMGTRFKAIGARSPRLAPLPGLAASHTVGRLPALERDHTTC